jgi:hypothetical protein
MLYSLLRSPIEILKWTSTSLGNSDYARGLELSEAFWDKGTEDHLYQ